ncbi:putative serine/threonine protein phosphatase [Hanseniaspora osmophila]
MSFSSYELDQCLERLYKGELLPEVVIEAVCYKLKEILVKESNVVQLNTPVTVVGDIHGQFHDLLEIFKIGGKIPDTNYLFLGDYVDRGLYSVETITLLIVLKLRYPQRIHLIRGNHESRQITQSYGFYTECLNKYGGDSQVWKHFTDLFDYLVLSAVIDNELFCVHGGLSPNIQTIEQIKIIDRIREIPHDGAMADLVWSDPDETFSGGDSNTSLIGDNNSNSNSNSNSNNGNTNGISHNPNNPNTSSLMDEHFQVSTRGAGYLFGGNVVKKFCHLNNISRIYRAHQLCNEGYQVYFDGLLTTVWSAPNYCYRCGNKASILELYSVNDYHFNVFNESPEYNVMNGNRKLLNPSFFSAFDDEDEDDEDEDEDEEEEEEEEAEEEELYGVDEQESLDMIKGLQRNSSKNGTANRDDKMSKKVERGRKKLKQMQQVQELQKAGLISGDFMNDRVDIFSDSYQRENSQTRRVEYFL